MNKRRVIDLIAADAAITKVQATRALDSFMKVVRSSLERGEKVTLVGFGTFAISRRKSRIVREPKQGTTMRIEARRVARFAPGLELRMAVQNAKQTGPSNADDYSCHPCPS